MCGIVGVVGGITDPERFDSAVDLLAHRGPNDRGVECQPFAGGEVWLGFRRLAILDLSPRGHQPMYDASHELCIVFNGEVFNFRELRHELEGRGYVFRSRTDTEVILNAYREWGGAAVERFVGMFAFAVWDSRREELFLARDRLGIKPLYYWHSDGQFAFASEIKALLALNGAQRRLNPAAVAKFFTFLWVPDPETMLEGIQQIEPGHVVTVRDGRMAMRQFWDVPLEAPTEAQAEDAVQALDDLLFDSVQKRLISDVPLGAFLSGGVDSSLIVALMRRAGVPHIITQTVEHVPDDARYDIAPADAPYARIVRDHFGGLDYHEIALQPAVVDLLPKIVWHLDDPVADPAAISTFLICRAAKERATVMLSGIGAEELFAGYPRHYAALLGEPYGRLPAWLRHLVRHGLVERLPASRPGPVMAAARHAKKFLRSVDLPFEERYLGYLSYYNTEELGKLLTRDVADVDVYARHRACLERARGRDPVALMTYLDLRTFLPSLNLAYTDRGSMAASVEVRVPILDHRVVEFVARLPSALRIRGSRQKYILKRLAERYLPRKIVWRSKTGFGAPIRAWVVKDLRELIGDLLSPDRLRRRGVLRPETVGKIVEDVWAGREDNALRVWAFLTFELWAATFLDGDGMAPIA